MFYSQFILAKKGPLGTIWIAAHLERKLRKNQVADTDIGVSVDSILFPEVPIALRLSSHLLLGVVRIYNRKVNYLFDDCSEALLNVKQAFRSTAVDLPPEESKAPYHSITLPETFDLDDFELPDSDIFQGNYVDHHISSREQITLQDNMEGVSYSTSKFGLDERFGDGDASGLDLDEELFLDKIGSAGHADESADPQASIGSMSSPKQVEHPEDRPAISETMVDGGDEDHDVMDYAPGPSTPGLVEEPNLSTVQEASAYEEHMESEYHAAESTMRESSKSIPYEDKQEVDWSSRDHPISPQEPAEVTGHELGGLEIEETKPEGESVTNDEFVSVKDSSPVLEAPSEIHKDDLILNEIGSGKNPEKVLEGESMKDLSSIGVDVLGSEGNENIGQKSCPDASELVLEKEDGSLPENAETFQENADFCALNIGDHDKETSSGTPFLRPCNSIPEKTDLQSDVSGLDASGKPETAEQGEECCVTGNSEQDLKENQVQEPAIGEPNDEINNLKSPERPDGLVENLQGPALHEHYPAASSEPNDQINNLKSLDSENLKNSEEIVPPAPEKMLSVPEGHVDQSTPGGFEVFEEGDAVSKNIAGKKRSFTESTLTEQSLNSVESSRQVRGKRTAESVPDDNDLLSSILVGRRSSVLKVKPTPISEVTSVKRTRTSVRSGAPKRKILIDDTMVLHGDTIRQQLMNTEDIRRVRKKAPCTRPEIRMIQIQNLEDEFFLAAVFSGVSAELASLHSQAYDLSQIIICQNPVTETPPETVAEPSPPFQNDDVTLESVPEPSQNNEIGINHVTQTDKTEIAEPVLDNEPLFAGEKDIAEADENPLLSEDRPVGANVELNGCEEQIKPVTDTETVISQQELLAEVETSPVNTEPVNPAVTAEVKALDSIGDASVHMVETVSLNENISAVNVENGEPMAFNDAQEIGRGEIMDKDSEVDGKGGIIPGTRDDILSDMASDVPNAEHDDLEYNVQNEMYNGTFEEQFGEFSVQATLVEDGNVQNAPDAEEAYQPNLMDSEICAFGLQDQDELHYSAAGNDTEFLNVDDDELNGMDDDDMADDQEARFTENTGWSSRTRAVSKYLQTTFIKEEAESGKKSLSLDSLLMGKTRKEASRMFFETLVLKTRDYIHVEQRNPCGDITIKPRTKLMKSDF